VSARNKGHTHWPGSKVGGTIGQGSLHVFLPPPGLHSYIIDKRRICLSRICLGNNQDIFQLHRFTSPQVKISQQVLRERGYFLTHNVCIVYRFTGTVYRQSIPVFSRNRESRLHRYNFQAQFLVFTLIYVYLCLAPVYILKFDYLFFKFVVLKRMFVVNAIKHRK